MTELLKPRWLLIHLLIAAICVAFVGLGRWQLQRHRQRLAANALLAERLALAPEPLAALLVRYRLDVPEDNPESIAYRPAQLTGRFDPAHEVLYRINASYDGQPGYWVLTPLLIDGDEAVLVMRGWVPAQMNRPPLAAAPPPAGEVTLVGIVEYPRAEQRGALVPRDPPGELAITAYIDTERLAQQMPYRLLPLFIELRQQQPPHPERYPLPPPEPEFSIGSHLGYAIQWFSFVVITLVGYAFILRGIARERSKPATIAA